MGSPKAKRSSPPQVPDKPYFKIGEVAAIAGVAASVLRFWETQFRALTPEKTRTNQRVYARKHVELALRIKELLYDRGYTIAGAKRRLAEGEGGAAPAPAPRDVLEKLKKEVRELLQLVDE
jgi:DNA-binding transcriptional MerR regulator